MSQSHIIVPDISTLDDVESRILSSSGIKEEIVGDEDILLFSPADLEAFSGSTSNYRIVEDIVNNPESVSDCSTFNMQGFDEGQVTQLFSGAENYSKFPIDLTQMCKLEPTKTNGSSHYIKYKMQDGKHSKVWECGICAKEFGHQYTLMRHLPTHTDERKFQCNTCGKAFRQMSTLSQHRAIHSADRPYVCEICHKTFNRVSTLISHRKTHTGYKPHRCHLCNKAFHQKGNLRNHIFTHTNERPYKCDVCNKGFNQMSNLMCHKVKAHQRADKPRYICQICGRDFHKRMGLRNHEQYQHGVQNLDTPTTPSTPTRVKYTNGVLVNPINTAAMQHALATNQTPFALLRPLNGIPVLVRVLAAGEKQMLVPATAEDLKKHGQITITPQIDEQNKKEESIPDIAEADEKGDDDITKPAKSRGSTVQIKIPVVATVVQRCGKDGNMCMAVQSPGPNGEGTMNEDYIFTTTTSDGMPDVHPINDFTKSSENPNFHHSNEENHIRSSTHIQFMDECGNLLSEDEAKGSIFANSFPLDQNTVFDTNIHIDNNVINIPDNQNQDILRDIDTENVMSISYVDQNSASQQMFEILEKPQVISLNDADCMLDANILYDDLRIAANYEIS